LREWQSQASAEKKEEGGEDQDSRRLRAAERAEAAEGKLI
jgi:hypothetical protein